MQCSVYTTKYTVYYTKYTVYARIHRIYTATGSFVGDVFLRFMWHFDAAFWSIWYSHFPTYSELQQFFQLPPPAASFSWVPTLTCCGPPEFCRWGGSSSSGEALLHILPKVLGGRKVILFSLLLRTTLWPTPDQGSHGFVQSGLEKSPGTDSPLARIGGSASVLSHPPSEIIFPSMYDQPLKLQSVITLHYNQLSFPRKFWLCIVNPLQVVVGHY